MEHKTGHHLRITSNKTPPPVHPKEINGEDRPNAPRNIIGCKHVTRNSIGPRHHQ